MAGIDETIEFQPVHIAVMTVSDTRTEETDTSGPLLADRLREAGHILAEKIIVRDEQAEIEAALRRWIADDEVEVVLAT